MEVNIKKLDAQADISSAGEVCQVFIFNPDLVNRLKAELDDSAGIAALFKLLGDESRCTMLRALSRSHELCVCDLAEITDLSLPTVSHHLRKLREMKVVRSRREGKLVFYQLADERIRTLLEVVSQESPLAV